MAISKKPFGVTPDGHDVTQFTLTNARGASVRVINYGAILTNIIVPDRNGVLDDVALGFDNLEGYLANHGSMGDTVGRYGNRIAQARFTIDGATYQLDRNNGENHLHGVLSKQLWAADPVETANGDFLRLHYVSPDGEDHFPGTLDVTVTYGWDDDCNLSIHILTVDADAITPVSDKALIPTGGYMPVAGTPFDMRSGLRLGDGLDAASACPQMAYAGGYDHNFVLRKGEAMGRAAKLYDPKSGRVMETRRALRQILRGLPRNPAFPGFAESAAVYRHDAPAPRRKIRHDDHLRLPRRMILLRASQAPDFLSGANLLT